MQHNFFDVTLKFTVLQRHFYKFCDTPCYMLQKHLQLHTFARAKKDCVVKKDSVESSLSLHIGIIKSIRKSITLAKYGPSSRD